jgi:hypothetical protein
MLFMSVLPDAMSGKNGNTLALYHAEVKSGSLVHRTKAK